MTKIIHSPHPILPGADRKTHTFQYKTGMSISECLEESSVDFNNQPVILYLNDLQISEDKWNETKTDVNDLITIRSTVHGGGDGGSNPIVTILTIALMIYAPWAGAQMFGYGTVGAAVTGGIIMAGGTMLIGALYPPVAPSITTPDDEETVSPTYSISGTRNRGRQYSTFPLVVGNVRMYPDLAAKPYPEYVANDQYLNQLFSWGVQINAHDPTNLKIGDTALSTYSDYTTQVGSTIDLFPSNVDIQPGVGELAPESSYITYTSPIDTTAIVIDLTTIIFAYNKEGKKAQTRVFVNMQYRAVGDVTWLTFATATAFSDGTVEIIGETKKPQRHSYRKVVTKGQYEVRIKNPTKSTTDQQFTGWFWAPSGAGFGSPPQWHVAQWHDALWKVRNQQVFHDAIKFFQPDTGNYELQTRTALRVRASGQLSGQIDVFNGEVSSTALMWNGSAWVNTTLEADHANPAWIFMRLLRGRKYASGKLAWGAGFADAQIDTASIIAWGTWCDTKNLKCNFVFDKKLSILDMLNTVARVGRGTVSWASGKTGIVYDQDNLPITQVFGMSNMIEGTFNITYITENLADEISVRFTNQDLNWQGDVVKAKTVGTTIPLRAVVIDLPGVTTVDQAGREANLLAARQYYHKRRVSFETDVEGLVCTRGDVISISHDLVNWGNSGRLKAGSTDTIIKLYEPITMTFGQPNWFAVRAPDGTYEQRQVVYASGEQTTITLQSALSFNPSTDATNIELDYLWFFEPTATPGKKFKILDLIPMSEGSRVKIMAIDEIDAYYTAEGGSYDYVAPTLQNTAQASISDVQVTEDLVNYDGTTEVHLTWKLEQAIGARIRVQFPNGNLIDYGQINGTEFSFTVFKQEDIVVEFTPYALVNTKEAPQTVSITYTVLGATDPTLPINVLPNVSGLELFEGGNTDVFTGKHAKFKWRNVNDGTAEFGNELYGADSEEQQSYFKDYEVRIFNTDGTERRTENVVTNEYIYTFEKNSEDGDRLGGNPVRNFYIEVYIRSQMGDISLYPAKMTVSNPAPIVPTNIRLSSTFKTVFIEYDRPSDTDFVGIKIWKGTTPGFTVDDTSFVYEGTETSLSVGGLDAGTTYYFRLAPYDAFGDDEINTSSEYNIATAKVDTIDIADLAIGSLQIDDKAVLTTKINDLAVQAGQIDTDAVTTTKILDKAVLTAKINDLAVQAAQIDTDAVTTTKILDAAITNAKIQNLAVDEAKIANLGVTNAKIADLAVSTAKIALLAVDTGQINSLAVTNAKIGALAVDEAKIANLGVTNAKIADLAVNNAKIADLSVSTAKIQNLAVDTGQINDLAVSTGKIQNLAVDTAQIQNLAVDTIKIANRATTDYVILDVAGYNETLYGTIIEVGSITYTTDATTAPIALRATLYFNGWESNVVFTGTNTYLTGKVYLDFYEGNHHGSPSTVLLSESTRCFRTSKGTPTDGSNPEIQNFRTGATIDLTLDNPKANQEYDFVIEALLGRMDTGVTGTFRLDSIHLYVQAIYK